MNRSSLKRFAVAWKKGICYSTPVPSIRSTALRLLLFLWLVLGITAPCFSSLTSTLPPDVASTEGRPTVSLTLAPQFVAVRWHNDELVVCTKSIKGALVGWNKLADLNSTNAATQTYMWGLDLSGTLQGAGGVGGLAMVNNKKSATYHFTAYDGNGNVAALVGTNNIPSANYEYGPFGEVIRASGFMGSTNAFAFSTKAQDIESGLVYYGYRYYNPSTGRWLSRDPIGLRGGLNEYGFCGNDGVSCVDFLGLSTKAWGGQVADWIDMDTSRGAQDMATSSTLINLGPAIGETVAQGFADMFRLGESSGEAFYETDGDFLDRMTVASQDFTRFGGIVLTVTPIKLPKGLSPKKPTPLEPAPTTPKAPPPEPPKPHAGDGRPWDWKAPEGAPAKPGKTYADRVRERGLEDPKSHNFPYSFDDAILATKPIPKKGGYNIFQKPGTMNGKNGVFEIGVNQDGVIDHRFFRPDP